MNELITLENDLVSIKLDPEKIFCAGGMTTTLEAIEKIAEAEAMNFDPEEEEGRKKFGSLGRQISSSKVFIETLFKKRAEELKKKLKPIDGERIRFCSEMDALRVKIDEPRQKWLRKQKEIEDAANETMRIINESTIIFTGTTSAELSKRIEQIEQINVETLPEAYRENAEAMLGNALAKLYSEHSAIEKREAEAKELEKLRAEAEERKSKESAEAAEKDRIAREDEIRKTAEAKAERDRLAAEVKAKSDQEAAVKAAQEAEREKIAREIADKEEAEAKAKAEAAQLAADEKHRENVHKTAMDCLCRVCNMTLMQASNCIDAIALGEIACVKMEY